MKKIKNLMAMLIMLLLLVIFFFICIFSYLKDIDDKIYDIASNNLESTYETLNDYFYDQIDSKWSDLKLIDSYLATTNNEEDIKSYIGHALEGYDASGFYFISDNNIIDLNGNISGQTFNNIKLIEKDTVIYIDDMFYYIISVPTKSYLDFNYNEIAFSYSISKVLDNLSIKAYTKDSSSALMLINGKVLAASGTDKYDLIFDEIVLDDNFKVYLYNYLNDYNIDYATCEIKVNNIDYYLHFQQTNIDGLLLVGLITKEAMELTMVTFRNNYFITITALFLIGITILTFLSIGYYKRDIVSKDGEINIRNKLFEKISENMDDIFILFDSKNKPLYISPNCTRLIGVTPEDIKDDFNKLLSCDASNEPSILEKAKNLKSGDSISKERNLMNKQTNETYWCLDKIYKYETSNEDFFICILADRTKEKQTVQQIESALNIASSANHAKTTFLSNMSHDLRTPMNAILGFSSLLVESSTDPKCKEYALKINSSSKILMGLINDILDLSKIEAGKQVLNTESTSIGEILNKIDTIISPLAKAKKIKFIIDAKDIEHETIETDKTKIIQVFSNVISNSVKYTNTNGIVKFIIREIHSESSRIGKYEFIIEDNGIGMSKEFIDDIFLPFAREQKKVKEIQGTGLGMPIAKNIIDLLGGTIKVDSKEGFGTKFTIRLDFSIEGLNNVDNLIKNSGIKSIMFCTNDTSDYEQAYKFCKKHNIDLYLNDFSRDYDVLILDDNTSYNKEEVKKYNCLKIGLSNSVKIIDEVDYTLTKPLLLSKIIRVWEKFIDKSQLNTYRLDNLHLLIVEDNETNVILLTEILKNKGATFDVAYNGCEAVEYIKKGNKYNCILMDVVMPVMNGYESTRQIRGLNTEYTNKVGIIAMTANAFSTDIEESKNAGMTGHISKPIDFVKLIKIIKEQSIQI